MNQKKSLNSIVSYVVICYCILLLLIAAMGVACALLFYEKDEKKEDKPDLLKAPPAVEAPEVP